MSSFIEEKKPSPKASQKSLYKLKEWFETKDDFIEMMVNDFDYQNFVTYLPLEKSSNKNTTFLFQYIIASLQAQVRSGLQETIQKIEKKHELQRYFNVIYAIRQQKLICERLGIDPLELETSQYNEEKTVFKKK